MAAPAPAAFSGSPRFMVNELLLDVHAAVLAALRKRDTRFVVVRVGESAACAFDVFDRRVVGYLEPVR